MSNDIAEWWGIDETGPSEEEQLAEWRAYRKALRKKEGWRRTFWRRVNEWAERVCVRHIARCHDDHLKASDWPSPWWFRLASKVEWWTRPCRASVNKGKST